MSDTPGKTTQRRRLAIGLGIALALALLYSVLMNGKSIGDIPAGTGYAALDLCSRTLVTDEPAALVLERYLEPKVKPLPLLWKVRRDERGVSVRTVLPGLSHERVAIFRPGQGCTVVPPDADVAEVRAQPFTAQPTPSPAPSPWPLGEGEADPTRLSTAERALIEQHEKRLFAPADPQAAEVWNTTALLVARGGELVHERYGQGHARAQRQLGWSMTKTVTALIAGTLAARGQVALDAPVGLPRWSGTDKAAITWRALLNMAPGLAWFEGYGGVSDATTMLFSRANQGAWAADRPLTSAPGSVFNYSTGFSNIAMLRMRQLLRGSHQALHDHYQSVLFAPLGIREGIIEPDASGTPVGGARGFLRPVDWLRLGELVLRDGSWQGESIVPAEWIAFMMMPSPASSEYGGSMWLRDAHFIDDTVRRRLPADIAIFAGHQGQFTIVVPGHDLVVLRMGVGQYPDDGPDPIGNEVLSMVADLIEQPGA